VVGLAFDADGRLEAFVTWLPVPARKAWTLDLMRRRPDSTYGVVEALIVRSIEEARSRGIAEVSLGMTPRIIRSPNGARSLVGAGRRRRDRRAGAQRYPDSSQDQNRDHAH